MDEATVNGVKNERKAIDFRYRTLSKKLYKYDVMGSIAHVTALGETRLIPQGEAEVLQRALTQVFYDVTNEKLALPSDTDLFDFLDSELKTRVGEIGEKINVGRTREDRIALDVRAYARELSSDINEYVKTVIKTLISVAEVNTLTFLPFSYNGTEGQPTTAAHVLLARAESFMRDAARLKKAAENADGMPLYSGYGTGLRLPVDKKRVAELLKFRSIAANCADAISDTDFARELLFATEVFADHVRTLLSDVREWMVKGYVLPAEGFSQPSDVRLLSVVPSGVNALLAAASSLSATCRDYGCDAPLTDLFRNAAEAENAVKSLVPALNDLIASLSFDAQASLKAAQSGYSTAADCVDYLIAKGETKSEATETVTKLCVYCRDNGKRLDTLPIEIYKDFSDKFDADVVSDMRVRNAVRLRKNEGEPSDVSTRSEIRSLNRRLTKTYDKD